MGKPLQEDEAFLEHFGVKGQKWGVRKATPTGATRSTNRRAKKDASEFARAKLFYGNGAGTRRKLIKATVEQRSKNEPGYKKAFDAHLAKQNMAKQADKAVKERTRTDRTDRTKKQAGYVARRFTGEMGTQAAFTAAAFAGVAFIKSPKGKQMMNSAYAKAKTAANSNQSKKYVNNINDVFKRSGL